MSVVADKNKEGAREREREVWNEGERHCGVGDLQRLGLDVDLEVVRDPRAERNELAAFGRHGAVVVGYSQKVHQSSSLGARRYLMATHSSAYCGR